MTFDPADFVSSESNDIGIRAPNLEIIAMDSRSGNLTLLYGQRPQTGESLPARATLESSDSVVVAIQTQRWNPKHVNEIPDGQLPYQSLDLAGMVANRLDVVFRGYLCEVQGLTVDPRSALSHVIATLQSWEEEAQSNPWWPSAITQPSAAPSLDLAFDNDRVTLRCYAMGKVLVSVPTLLTIDDTQLSVVVAIRGTVPPDLSVYQILDPMDIELGGYPRLLLPA
ncbi:MAG: hypothetical protein ACP5HZ_11610 [Ferrimicrobium sp.]